MKLSLQALGVQSIIRQYNSIPINEILELTSCNQFVVNAALEELMHHNLIDYQVKPNNINGVGFTDRYYQILK